MNPSSATLSHLPSSLSRNAERAVLRARNGIKHVTGIGRTQVAMTPKTTIWRRDKVVLWRYSSDRRIWRPPILCVLSLLNRSYIFDLRPQNSVVEYLLDQGFDVFLVDWGIPDEADAGNTLETYVDEYLPRVVRRVCDTSGADGVTIVGYCFGAVLSLMLAAGHPKLPVRSLVTLAAPVDFAPVLGMSRLFHPDLVCPDDLVDETGNVPASVLLRAFRMLKPTGALVTYANLWQHLWNDEFVRGYQAMDQWVRDSVPFPGGCFRQVQHVLRDNALIAGRLELAGRPVDIRKVRQPLVNVIAENDHLVPIESATPLTTMTESQDVQELRIPLGHMALVMGRQAWKVTLPGISDWIRKRSTSA